MERKRDYRKEYRDFHGTPRQIKRRTMTNQARAKVGLKVGDPREVDHIKALNNGGSNHISNLRIVSRTYNRKKGDKK